MAQVFPSSANQIAKASVILGAVLAVTVSGTLIFVVSLSAYVTRQR